MITRFLLDVNYKYLIYIYIYIRLLNKIFIKVLLVISKDMVENGNDRLAFELPSN
jgi:hypothetical protein